MSDPDEPLIDGIHGHGSQSLINLMVTGCPTSHVWDGEHNLGGLSKLIHLNLFILNRIYEFVLTFFRTVWCPTTVRNRISNLA